MWRNAATLLLLLLSLTAACGSEDTTGNAPADEGVKHPLIIKIDRLQGDFAALLSEIKAAPAAELQGAKGAEMTRRLVELGTRAEELQAEVIKVNDAEVSKHWDASKPALEQTGKEAADLLPVTQKPGEPKARLEVKQMGDLWTGFKLLAIEPRAKEVLQDKKAKERGGRRFYEFAFKHKLLDAELLKKLASPNSPADFPSNGDFIESDGELADYHCSYTAPRAGELLAVMSLKGAERAVLVCFNALNWRNYPLLGVLVQWSDADVPVFMSFEEAKQNWGITAEEWADPAGKLFGKKAPFQHTYE